MAGERVVISKEEAATIKAALRLFQETYQDHEVDRMLNDFPMEFDGIAPLDSTGIEELLSQLEE